MRELERAFVFGARLVCAAEAAEQVGSRGLEVVAVQIEPLDDPRSTSAAHSAWRSSQRSRSNAPTSSQAPARTATSKQ
jgi:hypothetical protein